MRAHIYFFNPFLIFILMASCSGSNSEEKSATNNFSKMVKGNVTIGRQVWMRENLNVDTFCNGDAIFEAKTIEDWVKASKLGEPAFCYYGYESANEKKFGKLYNFYAVSDTRGIAPFGYHIPTDADWSELINFMGKADDVGERMRSTNGWENNGNGTDNSQLSLLPGGYCGNNGYFAGAGEWGLWWSSTEHSQDNAIFYFISYDGKQLVRHYKYKEYGHSVRCLKN
jgi:uncharacterized protein (TIGR02145 family)